MNLQSYGSSGARLLDVSLEFSPATASVVSNCAWRSDAYLCAIDSFSSIGSSADAKLPTNISVFPKEDNIIAVHWDGETFSLHATSQNPQAGALQLIRLDTSGKVIQPRTHVGDGVFGSFTPERSRVVTDPKSGRTFVVAGSSLEAMVASAHERDGTLLFAKGSVLSTTPNIVSQYPAVGVYGDGALIATQGDRTASVMWPKPNFYHLSAAGQLTVLPKIPLADEEVVDSNIQIAMVAHGPNDGWLALSTVDSKSGSRLVLLDWKDGAFGPIQVIMDAHDVVPAKKDYFLRLVDPIAFELDGQRWVGVKDWTVSAKPAVRLFRVDDPSCRYAPISP